jgi:hypothetical protein
MYARMWGGLLQDTFSPMGDMVHFLFLFVFFSLLLVGVLYNYIYIYISKGSQRKFLKDLYHSSVGMKD